jgi:hypothetical protein
MTHAVSIADWRRGRRLRLRTVVFCVLVLSDTLCACEKTNNAQASARPHDEPSASDANVAVSDAAVVADAGALHPAVPIPESANALVALSRAELDALCAWSLGLLVVPTKRQLCTLLSLQAASEVACNAAVYACEKTQPIGMDPPARCDSPSVQSLPARCAAVSVQEFEACANAAAQASNERLANISCRGAKRDATVDVSSPPAACLALNTACPELAPKGSGARAPWSGGSFLCDDGWPLFAEEACNGVQECEAGEDERGC